MRQHRFQKSITAGKRLGVAALVVAAVVLTATPSQAQIRPDARIGFFTNGSNLTLGGGFQMKFDRPFAFEPTAEFIFANNETRLFFSGDLQYYFWLREVNLYAGAGLGVLSTSYNGYTNTTVGLNLLTGIDFRATGFIPYVQAKIFIANGTSAQLAFGIRF